MTDRIKTFRPDGSEGAMEPLSRLGLLVGSVIETIAATALTLSDSYHGKILDFTNGSAVAVTIPAGLRPDFICGISQGGVGQVTVAAGADTTLGEPDDQFATEKQLVMLTLMAFSANTYRLYGRTA